jgi:YD repeat-containing protein
MLTTTLNRIRAHHPCANGWSKLLRGLRKAEADDARLPFARIVEIRGLVDAVWCCRAESKHNKEWRLFAVRCAEDVKPWMPDKHSVEAVRIIERYVRGDASRADLAMARRIAREALVKAEKKERAKGVAHVCATVSAARAAYETAHPQAYEAAYNVVQAIAEGAWDASGRSISHHDAWVTAINAMTLKFLQIVGAPEGNLC